MKRKMFGLKKVLAGVLTASCVMVLLPQGIAAADAEEEIVYEEEEFIDADAVDDTFSELYAGKPTPEQLVLGDSFDTYVVKGTSDSDPDAGIDVYEINIPSAGRLTLNAESEGIDFTLSCKLEGYYDLHADYEKEDVFWQIRYDDYGNDGEFTQILDLTQTAGKSIKYYLYAVPSSYAGSYGDEIEYSISTNFVPITVGKNEKGAFDTKVFGSNNDENSALDIETDQTYVAQSTYDNANEADWYAFSLKTSSKLYLTASTSEIDDLKFRLYSYNPIGRPVLFSSDPCPIEVGNQVFDSKGKAVNSVENFSIADISGKGVFDPGDYYIAVQKQFGANEEKSKTGSYRFKISTKVKSAKPVTAVQIVDNATQKDLAKVSINPGTTRELTALVKPADAEDTAVTWEIDKPEIASFDVSDGVLVLKGISVGTCTLTVTTEGLNKDGNKLSDTCEVTVRDAAEEKECPTVITKQKVDLTTADYFGSPIDTKNEKLMVVDPENADAEKPKASKLASVDKKGLLTAKKPGNVVVLRMEKTDGKNFETVDKISFEIETPVINYPMINGKPAKNFTIYKKGTIYNTADLITTKSSQTPKFSSSDKKNKLGELSTPNGQQYVMFKSGTVKLTAEYGEGKNAAKYTIVIKGNMPKLKEKVSVKVGKTATVTVSNIQPGVEYKWMDPYEYDENDKLVPSNKFEYVSVNDKKVTIRGLVKGKALVPINIDGANYFCEVTVK